MGNEVSTRVNLNDLAGLDRIEMSIDKIEAEFAKTLPATVPAERFARVLKNALQDPNMEEVLGTPPGRFSILTESLKASNDGLLLDGRQAVLVPRKKKVKVGNVVKDVRVAVYQPMWQGLLHLAYNSGVIERIQCQPVYSNDLFKVERNPDDGCPLTHKVDDPFGPRGDLRGVYAVAKFLGSGWSDYVIISVAEIERIRKLARAEESDAWKNHYAEMCKKTAIRRLTKYLPKSSDHMDRFDSAARRVDDMYDLGARVNEVAALPAPDETPRKVNMAAEILGAEVGKKADTKGKSKAKGPDPEEPEEEGEEATFERFADV